MTLLRSPNSVTGSSLAGASKKIRRKSSHHLRCKSGTLVEETQLILDYKLLAGVLIGVIITTPLVIIAAYLAFLKISAHIRAIVNEYGR